MSKLWAVREGISRRNRRLFSKEVASYRMGQRGDNISKKIASYLIEHYDSWPFMEYVARIDLPNGDILGVRYFCDSEQRGKENPLSKDRLEVILKSEGDGSRYETLEYGLTGKFDRFKILNGSLGIVLVTKEDCPKALRSHIQREYLRLLNKTLSALSRNKKVSS